jgi:hypothetical protein
MKIRNLRLLMICLMLSAVGVNCSKSTPFVGHISKYSIGIMEGPSPLALIIPTDVKNPVLTANDVTDIRADFVADPFMIIKDSRYYMFFEVMNHATNQGDIGFASSADGKKWKYEKIVIDEPFHISYPYVFSFNGKYYLIPESADDTSIRLYVADDFPYHWRFERRIISGKRFLDSSIMLYEGRWWVFTATDKKTLHLYFSYDLIGP